MANPGSGRFGQRVARASLRSRGRVGFATSRSCITGQAELHGLRGICRNAGCFQPLLQPPGPSLSITGPLRLLRSASSARSARRFASSLSAHASPISRSRSSIRRRRVFPSASSTVDTVGLVLSDVVADSEGRVLIRVLSRHISQAREKVMSPESRIVQVGENGNRP